MVEQTTLEKIDSLKRNQSPMISRRVYQPPKLSVLPVIKNKNTKRLVVNAHFKQSIGLCEKTGKALTGIEHLQQSFRNIILTEKFQRVMLRNYGSGFYERIDHPANENLFLRAYAEITALIEQWEPRFYLKQILIKAGERLGQFFYTFKGDFLGKFIEVGVNT